jgi:hypothetical protein
LSNIASCIHRLGGYGLVLGFRFYPCGLFIQGLRSKPLRPRDVLALYGARHRSPFNLATFIQRKMELNAGCSPDLSNDRRQNDVAGNRKINNDGVVLTPSIGQ